MSKSRKVFLFIVGVIIVIPVLFLALVLQFFDLTNYKQQLEANASEASEMLVSISGSMDIDLFPQAQIEINGLHLEKEGQQIADIKKINVGFDLLPLLHKEVRINSVELLDPEVSIARLEDGNFNVEKREHYNGTLPTLDLKSIIVANGAFHLDDIRAGTKYDAISCSIEATNLALADSKREDIFKHLGLAAEIGCGEVRKDTITMSDVKLSANGSDGKFIIKPIAMNMFGATGSGTLEADFTAEKPGYELQYSLPQFQAEAFLQAFFPKQTITGNLDFVAALAAQGKTSEELKQTVTGTLSMRGKGLVLHGIDLDEELAQFESTQNFSLIDVGAVFFAGPLGLAVTKGYDYASLFQRSESNSEIAILVSDWAVVNGVAEPQDVAMATTENLMALRGGLDLHNSQFNELTIALLDARGCVSVQQVIRGPFREPEIEKPGFLMALAGPAISLIKQGVGMLEGEACEPFYTGSLLRAQ